jgi:membrane-bound lytic murein transglycosylase B
MLVGGLFLVSAVVQIAAAQTGGDSTMTADAITAARKAQLQKELDELERLIAAQQSLLEQKQGERTSLERDVGVLDTKIKKAQLDIKARELSIRQLSQDIGSKQGVINELSEKLIRERESLAELIRKTAEIDDTSIVEIVLSNESISQFFEELDDFQAVKLALRGNFDDIKSIRTNTEGAKKVLEEKHLSALELKALQDLEKQKIEQQEREKKQILTTTKGQESVYKQQIAKNQKTAAQIRAELFELRGTKAIPFGQALEYANIASAKTGVRAAFILGVLKHETDLGGNLGVGNWQVDMHPTRDRPVFQAITSNLGLNPDTVPVSRKLSYGWGGAMGPAQFIPSTWACYGGFINTNTSSCSNNSGLSSEQFWAGPWTYQASSDRLRNLRGKASPSNPWDNQDAFFATAVYMMDLGAVGGPEAERRAALKYYAGGNWSNPSYAFYGDSVMEYTVYYQQQIDTLKQLGS